MRTYYSYNGKFLYWKDCISMAQHKTAVTPLLMHWSYCSLTLSHRFHNEIPLCWQDNTDRELQCKGSSSINATWVSCCHMGIPGAKELTHLRGLEWGAEGKSAVNISQKSHSKRLTQQQILCNTHHARYAQISHMHVRIGREKLISTHKRSSHRKYTFVKKSAT